MIPQKTRFKWIRGGGDGNTKFCHALIRDRRERSTIVLSQSDGTTITDANALSTLALSYFENMFSAMAYNMHEELYPSQIMETDNLKLTNIPDMKEV